MASKKKFDINQMAQAARKAAARRRTKKIEAGERVAVGGPKGKKGGGGGGGATGVAGPGGSIAARLAARESAELKLDFEDRAREDHPAEGEASGGDHLELSRTEHVVRYKLAGRRLDVGDLIEVYTNKNTGWLRGRFEWSGRAKDRPKLGLNLWNPNGPFEGGKPPWSGDLMCTLPEGAVCRWVE